MLSEALLEVRQKGQGDPAVPVLFPKLVFLGDLTNLHGEGKPNHDIFLKACECSNRCMYPDYVSLEYTDENENYIGKVYQKYGKAISPMGCRAFLSPLCINKKTGEYSFKMEEPEEWDFIVEGRFNLGACTIHLSLILAKSIEEAGYSVYNRDFSEEEQLKIREIFFKNVRFYLEMIEGIIVRTYNYIAEMPASVNPIMFTQGLAYGGNLKPDEKIGKILFASTSSYGYVGLEELQQLWNGKSLINDGDFAYEVLQFLSDFKDESKERTGINTALYSTPAESLAGTQLQQFRKKYGIIKNVSDKAYMTNSFHMPVSANITPIEKQDLEERFFKIPTGGRIQYVRIPNSSNLEAVKMLIERGIRKGYYQGINLQKSYGACGHEFFEEEYPEFNNRCPICGCDDITTITRVCGYMGLQRIHGDTKINDSKLAEISDRRSM